MAIECVSAKAQETAVEGVGRIFLSDFGRIIAYYGLVRIVGAARSEGRSKVRATVKQTQEIRERHVRVGPVRKKKMI